VQPFRVDAHAASSTVVAFMVSAVVFLGSVGALLVASRDAGGTSLGEPGEAAALALQAGTLADLLTQSPGLTIAGGQTVNWAPGLNSADALVRLGLRSPHNASMDFEKFQNLRRAPYAVNATDGYVNYEEARASLGLTDKSRDFHIRAFPSLKSVQEILATGIKDPNLRVTYIGHAETVTTGGSGNPIEGLVIGNATCTVRSDGKGYLISNVITNGGASSVQFSGFYVADLLANGTEAFADQSRSYLVPGAASAPNNTVTLNLYVPHKAGRTCAGATVTLEVWDKNARLGPKLNYTFATGSAATTAVARDLWANPSLPFYNAGSNVVLDFDGELPTKGSDPPVTLSLRITNSTGVLVYAGNLSVDKHIRSWTVPSANFTSDTNFLANLTDAAGGASTFDRILVLPGSETPSAYTPPAGSTTTTPTSSMAIEIDYLDGLVDKFCPYNYTSNSASLLPQYTAANYTNRCGFKAAPGTPNLTPAQPGDVFTDTRSVLNNDLPTRLLNPSLPHVKQCQGNSNGAPRYDIVRVLVVGSNVEHNAMTSGVAKHSLCEWVMGGGTLIVFGSAAQQANWLQPIFHAAIRSSSGGISTPDTSHPVLTRSDSLAYDGYVNHGVWSFSGQTAQAQQDSASQLFTNVVVHGSDPVLTISDPGAFGNGTVILTTWLPYDLFGTGPGNGATPMEGRSLLNNLLMQGYRDLFLDYGPKIPVSGRQAPSAERIVEIWHPEFAEAITLTVFVYAF
jgi:hypothetical protein